MVPKPPLACAASRLLLAGCAVAASLLSGCDDVGRTPLGVLYAFFMLVFPLIWIISVALMTLAAYNAACRFSRRPWAYAVVAALADPLVLIIFLLIPEDLAMQAGISNAWFRVAVAFAPAPAVGLTTWLLARHQRRHPR